MLTFSELKQLHQLYNDLTGFNLPWTMQRLYPWEQWGLHYTAEDLKTVVRYIQAKMKDGKPCRSLIFRSLISGPNSIEFFGEDLAMARTESLVRSKIKQQQGNLPRNHAMLSLGRPMPEPDRARSAEAILRGDQALVELLKVRDTL